MKLRKSFITISTKKTRLNKEKLAKTHQVIKINCLQLGFHIPKKNKKLFEIIINFFFISLWFIHHKITIKASQRNLQIMIYKKIAIFINNQLEGFFFSLSSSKIKYIYDFPTPKSQTPKNSKPQNSQHQTLKSKL